MNILKKIFGRSDKSAQNKEKKRLDIMKLVASDDSNNSIIIIDDFICELCCWRDDMDKLTEEQRNYYYIQTLEREVCNGGFSIYPSTQSN